MLRFPFLELWPGHSDPLAAPAAAAYAHCQLGASKAGLLASVLPTLATPLAVLSRSGLRRPASHEARLLQTIPQLDLWARSRVHHAAISPQCYREKATNCNPSRCFSISVAQEILLHRVAPRSLPQIQSILSKAPCGPSSPSLSARRPSRRRRAEHRRA